MPSSISIPLQVMGLGVVISYGIAVLIRVMLIGIRLLNKCHKRD